MDNYQPFSPQGPTFAIKVTGIAPVSATPVGVPIGLPPSNDSAGSTWTTGGLVTYRFSNTGGGDAFMAYGPTSTAAVAAAASVPLLSGGGQNVVYIKGGETRGFTLPDGMWWAGISQTGSGTVYGVCGVGIV